MKRRTKEELKYETIGKILKEAQFKNIQVDAMSFKSSLCVNSVKFKHKKFPNRIEIFLPDYYIWIYPELGTFETIDYGD